MPNDTIQLRRATASDADGIAALVNAAYEKYIPRIGRKPYPMIMNYADAVKTKTVWVAEEDGQLCGALVLIPSGDHLLIENIAVAPTFQGAGLGRRFLKLAEDEAGRYGFSDLRLYTNVRFTENIAIYTRHGYVETGRDEQNNLNVVFMRKTLA
ncbi:MAG: N-acetylglutamate synthase-like GNAT family acetyltransferase [Alphaproteobacteria bacterium]|jgi:N-acetylglutamate synthase-like GNAT family acetyltransferase